MNMLDIIIIAVMVFFLVKGLLRGFFKEIASLAGIILGIWLGIHFISLVSGYLKPYFPSTPLLSLISFALIFAVVLFLCNLTGWLISRLLKKAQLKWIDRGLGAGLAILKGIILTYLVIILLTFFLPFQTPLIAGSKLAPIVTRSYQAIVRLISPEHYKALKEKLLQKKKDATKIVTEKLKGGT